MAGRILIVESDENVRNVLCRALYAQHVHADELSDGRRAVEAIRSRRYSVVLLDLAVSAVDAFAVLDDIRNDESRPVLIALSASSAELDRLGGDPIVTMSIDKTFAMRNIDPIVAAIAAVSRMR